MNRAYLTITALSILAALSQPADADELLTTRKAAHTLASAAIAGVATDLTGSELEGFSIALAAGLAKEELDRYRRGKQIGRGQQPKDALTCKALLADAVGSAIGAKLGGLYVERQGRQTVVAYSAVF